VNAGELRRVLSCCPVIVVGMAANEESAARLGRRRFLALAWTGVLSACAGSIKSAVTTVPAATVPTSAAPPVTPAPSVAAPATTFVPSTAIASAARSYNAATSLWSQGNYAGVSKEIDAVNLPVTGSLPPELDGLYIRNGSNPKTDPSVQWFMGDGMMHGIRLEAGKASWYKNRWVKTAALDVGLRSDGKIPGLANNTSNTSMVAFGKKLLSLQEIGWPYEVDPKTLETVGTWDMAGLLQTSMTAHPKIDPVTGRLHFFGYTFIPPFLTYQVAEVDGTLVHSTPIDLTASVMMHDFAITDRDVIFWDLPAVFNLDKAINQPKVLPFIWDPSHASRVGIMPLNGDGKDIRWVDVDPCYVFHAANAWREGDDVVLDVCRLPSIFDKGLDLQADGAIARWRINTASATMKWSEQVLVPRSLDLPTIDLAQAGRPHDAAFYAATRNLVGGWEFAGIAGFNPVTGAVDEWKASEQFSAGEPLVVGDFVLCFVYDHSADASDLAVFDKGKIRRGPIATVRIPQRVPYGFHGTWLPGGVPR
jgi:carotenoid cleavage dioxygenase-like enzyme